MNLLELILMCGFGVFMSRYMSTMLGEYVGHRFKFMKLTILRILTLTIWFDLIIGTIILSVIYIAYGAFDDILSSVLLAVVVNGISKLSDIHKYNKLVKSMAQLNITCDEDVDTFVEENMQE